MATRLYFNRTAGLPADVGAGAQTGEWGTTVGASTHYGTLVLDGFEGGGSFLTTTSVAMTTASCMFFQMVTPPIQSSFDFGGGNYKLACHGRESSTSTNAYLSMVIGIMDQDGTKQAWTGKWWGATEFGTTNADRLLGAVTPFSYVTTPGQRFFIEVGTMRPSTTVSSTTSIRIADSTTASDQSSTVEGGTGTLNPWIETSHNWVFDPEGTTYGGTNKRLMMMGCGS